MKRKNTKTLSYCIIGLIIISGVVPTLSGDKADKAIVTLINEGFESGIPGEWTNTGWILNWYGFPHSGSNWVSNSAGGSYMETNPQTFSENTELRFWYCAFDSGEAQSLEVKIDSITVWSDIDFTHTTYQEAIVDLSSYTGTHTISFYNTESKFTPQNLDDILVTTELDIEPPEITNVDSQPPLQHEGQSVDITCDVTDNKGVEDVFVNITYPDSSVQSNLMSGSGSYSYSQVYTANGTYNYHIYATDINGNSAESLSYTFEINALPTAYFTFMPSNPTTLDVVSFTDFSSDPDGTIASWDWDFGDGGSSTSQHPTHQFDDGSFTVTLTVTDDDGGVDSFFDFVMVSNILPDADFSYAPSTPSTADMVSFTDLSSDPDGTIASWDWDFGDGGSSTSQHPSYSYDDDGIYTITLTITDDDEGTDVHTDTVTVTNVGPTADFNYDPIEPSILDTVQFTDLSVDTDGTIVSWDWDFGDGGSSTEQHPLYNFPVSDQYSISLMITDDDGATDTIIHIIDVSPPVERVDVNQSIQDRGFPIRHAADGDWAGAQSFIPTTNLITRVDIYIRVFGAPEFDLTVELRENHPQGTLIDTLTFTPAEVPSSWEWFNLDFTDATINPGTEYFIVCPPAPSGVTTSFGYEWGYAFGNQYDDGSFWFTRDGGGLWRDLPTMYEFTFRTYGL